VGAVDEGGGGAGAPLGLSEFGDTVGAVGSAGFAPEAGAGVVVGGVVVDGADGVIGLDGLPTPGWGAPGVPGLGGIGRPPGIPGVLWGMSVTSKSSTSKMRSDLGGITGGCPTVP